MELAFINLSPVEISIIVIIALLLFGSRLPSVARSLGKSVTEFKKGVKDLKEDAKSEDDDEPKKLEQKDSREVEAQKVEKEAEKVS